MDTLFKVYFGDASAVLNHLEPSSVDTCITSPPYYGLRDYGTEGQIGFEATPTDYVNAVADVMDKVRDTLRDDGTLWLNIGDSYAGSGKGRWGDGSGRATGKQATNVGSQQGTVMRSNDGNAKPKDLIGIPWMLAFELRSRGWYLRQDIIWAKTNPMPESVKDRCTRSHEYVFLLSKSRNYYFDHVAMSEPSVTYDETPRDRDAGKLNKVKGRSRMDGLTHGAYKTRNRRDVWRIPTSRFSGAHFATFPKKLVEPCVLAGSRKDGIVLDPFAGSCTTGVVALENGRRFIGIELNEGYARMGVDRLRSVTYQDRLEF